METDKNKQEQGSQTNPASFGGPDLSGFFSDPKTWEWLKPLLSGAGAMTGTYLLWIKPIQDKLDAVNLRITEQDKLITKLEYKIKELENNSVRLSHKAEEVSENLKGSNNDYFEIKNKGQQSGNFKKRRNLHL